MLPKSYKDGRIKADWINDKLYIQKGRLVYYEHTGFSSIYEHEIELTLENGYLKQVEQFDNSRSKTSIFSQKRDSLNQFIYRRIKWGDIPQLNDKKVRINIYLETSEIGKPNVKLLKESDDTYSTEALRVAQLIPDWDIIYKRGQIVTRVWVIPVIFSEENRRKYSTHN